MPRRTTSRIRSGPSARCAGAKPIWPRPSGSVTWGASIVGMNAFPDQGVGRLDRFIESHDPIGFFRPEDLLSAELPGEAPHVTEPLGLGQIGFAPAQRALGPLLILDVVSRGIPSDHLAVFIAQRHAPDEEP